MALPAEQRQLLADSASTRPRQEADLRFIGSTKGQSQVPTALWETRHRPGADIQFSDDVMPTLIYKSRIWYYSPGDEAAFFGWLQSIPGVVSVRGQGTELHIRMRSKRVSAVTLRELLALYERYKGEMSELAQFENASNTKWFRDPQGYWYKRVFVVSA